jgi:hypothetical protein
MPDWRQYQTRLESFKLQPKSQVYVKSHLYKSIPYLVTITQTFVVYASV